MTVQTSYNETPARGFQGQIAEQFSNRQLDSYVAEGDLNFGVGVVRGTNPEKQVKTIVGETDITQFMGISVAALQDIETEGAGKASYSDKAMCSIMDKGRVYVTAGETITVGAEVVPNNTDEKFLLGSSTSEHRCYARSAGGDGDVILIEILGPQG